MGNNPMDIDLQKMTDDELNQLWSALFIERMRRLQQEPAQLMHPEPAEGVDERYEDMIRWSNETFTEPTGRE